MRRGDGALHRGDAARARHQGEPHRARRAARRRARIRRCRHDLAGAAGPPQYLRRRLFMKRKLLAWVLLAAAAQVHAQIEKRDVHIAVGGKTALYYLPLTLTERLGFFKDEGLNVRISDFAGEIGRASCRERVWVAGVAACWKGGS